MLSIVRSVQSILYVEKIDAQTHHKPFSRHKQITIMKSAFSEVACARPNSTHRPSPELCSVLNKLNINLHQRPQAHFGYLNQRPRKHAPNTPNIK